MVVVVVVVVVRHSRLGRLNVHHTFSDAVTEDRPS